MPLEGNLNDVSLPSIVHVICLEQRKVALILKRRNEEGTIFFEEGTIVHATVGPLEGEDAIYHLLAWSDGEFRTKDDPTIPRRTVATHWNHLLMEGMKKIDERERDGSARLAAVLSTAEFQLDSELENEMILLLSRLEHLRSKLADKQAQKKPHLAVQVLAEMLNHVIEFSEELMVAANATDTLAKVLPNVATRYPSLASLKPENNRLPPATVVAQFNAANSSNRAKAFFELSRGIIHLIDTYFTLLMSCFRSSSVVDELREAYSFFVADLTQVIEGVRT